MIAQSLSLVKAERSQGRVKLQIWAKRRILSVLLQEILRFSLGILHRIPEAIKTEPGGAGNDITGIPCLRTAAAAFLLSFELDKKGINICLHKIYRKKCLQGVIHIIHRVFHNDFSLEQSAIRKILLFFAKPCNEVS
ncbi:MAG: hypothetical protein HFF83_00510 [Oscillibacter sp.]|jgi:hypothetical protein|nr:hypothetical protein [Oscillibacter sp.]